MEIKIKFIKSVLFLSFFLFAFTVLAQVETKVEISVINNSTVNFCLAGQYKNNYQQSARIDISDPFATANTSIAARTESGLAL